MADEIIELLKNEKLRAQLAETIQTVYSHAELDLEVEPPGPDGMINVSRSCWDDAWLAAYGKDDFCGLHETFQQYVIDRMSRPERITIDELAHGFDGLAKPVQYRPAFPDIPEMPDWESVHKVFISYVENCLLTHRRLPAVELFRCPTDGPSINAFRLGVRSAGYGDEGALAKLAEELSGLGENGASRISTESQELLSLLPKVFEELFSWSSANGIEVRCSRGRAEGGLYYVVAEVAGRMSAAASERLQSEMTCLLKSIIRSIWLLEPGSGGYLLPEEPVWGRLAPLELDEDTLPRQAPFVRTCLDAFYAKPAKKDSIDRRIRNAVHLLMESDIQSNDALGLALSVTAMEALLGMGSTEISERLSTNVAVLLEPELDKRHGAAEFAKRLYGARSDALHGKSLEKDERAREQAHLLAAGILRAMVTRREFMQKSGFAPETPQDLLEELRTGRFQPGQTVGVDEPNVRKLWRDS